MLSQYPYSFAFPLEVLPSFKVLWDAGQQELLGRVSDEMDADICLSRS